MSRFFRLANLVQGLALVSIGGRARLLRRFGLACDPTARIHERVFFGSDKVRIGARSFVSVRCLLDGSDRIAIGDDVHLGPGVSVLTSTHDHGPPSRRAGPVVTAPVVIGDGCWIGANATILPGVTIAPGCVVGAGALVLRNTEPDGLYLGVPAERRADLDGAVLRGAPADAGLSPSLMVDHATS